MTRMQAQPEAATKRNAGATRDIDPTIAAGTLSTAATSTETPPSRPLKRPGANLDLSPPASAPRAAPVGSGAATESGSDSGQDMDADYDPLPPSKDGRCHNYERNPQQVGAPTSKDLFPDFKQQKEGILASATAVSMKAALLDEPGYRWNNERAMEEAQRASKYVIDVDFSLSRFGDPYEDTEVWVHQQQQQQQQQ
ncbi:hypothetical protein KEM54_000795 [Ascosphaera aggregata]|nr:hypothetical protein KEM54_000795 [Ascosphaera aggregata]